MIRFDYVNHYLKLFLTSSSREKCSSDDLQVYGPRALGSRRPAVSMMRGSASEQQLLAARGRGEDKKKASCKRKKREARQQEKSGERKEEIEEESKMPEQEARSDVKAKAPSGLYWHAVFE